MKRKVEMILDLINNAGNVRLLLDGKEIPCLYGFDIKFDSRANIFTFKGKRLATDEYGQFFVDKETKETAIEEIDLLHYFSDEGQIAENVKTMKKEVEFALKNTRDTSLFNARKMIAIRLG